MEPLRDGLAAGRRPRAVSGRPADRGPAGRSAGANLAVVPAQAGAGGLAAALVLALVVGFTGITWNWWKAQAAEKRALAQAAKAEAAEKDARAQSAKADAINEFS